MELVGFFLPYVRRYIHWGLLALAGIVVFGVATLAFVGLINPMFEEVLLATEDEIQEVRIGGLGGDGDEEDGGAVARLFEPVESFTAGLRAAAANLYDVSKRWAGIEGRSEVFFAPALMVLVLLLRSLMAFLSGYSFQRAGLGITTDIRNDLYRHIIHQSSRFHQRYTSGELYSRVVSDVAKLQERGCGAALRHLHVDRDAPVLRRDVAHDSLHPGGRVAVRGAAVRLPAAPLRQGGCGRSPTAARSGWPTSPAS